MERGIPASDILVWIWDYQGRCHKFWCWIITDAVTNFGVTNFDFLGAAPARGQEENRTRSARGCLFRGREEDKEECRADSQLCAFV